jgi:hypothetical protein
MADHRFSGSLVRLPPTLPVDFPPFNPSHPFYATQTNSTPELVQTPNRGGDRGRPLLRPVTSTQRKNDPQAAAPVAQEERSHVLAQLDHVSCVPPKPQLRSRSWSVRKTLVGMACPKPSDEPRISSGELSRPLSKLVDNIGRSLSRRPRKASVSTQPIPMPVSSIPPQANRGEDSKSRRYGKIYTTSPL